MTKKEKRKFLEWGRLKRTWGTCITVVFLPTKQIKSFPFEKSTHSYPIEKKQNKRKKEHKVRHYIYISIYL